MAPSRPAPGRRTGAFGAPGEGFSPVGFKNKNVKQRTWRPNHLQAFVGSVREGKKAAFLVPGPLNSKSARPADAGKQGVDAGSGPPGAEGVIPEPAEAVGVSAPGGKTGRCW